MEKNSNQIKDAKEIQEEIEDEIKDANNAIYDFKEDIDDVQLILEGTDSKTVESSREQVFCPSVCVGRWDPKNGVCG